MGRKNFHSAIKIGYSYRFRKNNINDLMKYSKVLHLSPHYRAMELKQTDINLTMMKTYSSAFTITTTTPLG